MLSVDDRAASLGVEESSLHPAIQFALFVCCGGSLVILICIFCKVRLCYVSLGFIRLLHSAFLDHLTDKFLFLFDGLELLAIHQLTGVTSLPDRPAEELLAELASLA